MKALIQRVQWAEVEVEYGVIGRIGHGMLVYLAVAPGDGLKDARDLADKIANLRIFQDEEGKMNRTVRDARGGVLAVSNFTLLADASKGRRPAFTDAAPAQQAQPLYEAFVSALRELIGSVQTGIFGASMTVRSAADGPVNILLDMPPLPDLPQPSRPSSYESRPANREIAKQQTAKRESNPLRGPREDEINL